MSTTPSWTVSAGNTHELAPKDRQRAMQSWREVFAVPLYQARGRWKDGQFEWHLFSGKTTPALNGARAQAAYAEEARQWNRGRKRAAPGGGKPTYCVVPEDLEYRAFQVAGGQLPDFSACLADVYVWPANLGWTMAFTHEAEAMGLGPYFSRREWLGA